MRLGRDTDLGVVMGLLDRAGRKVKVKRSVNFFRWGIWLVRSDHSPDSSARWKF